MGLHLIAEGIPAADQPFLQSGIRSRAAFKSGLLYREQDIALIRIQRVILHSVPMENMNMLRIIGQLRHRAAQKILLHVQNDLLLQLIQLPDKFKKRYGLFLLGQGLVLRFHTDASSGSNDQMFFYILPHDPGKINTNATMPHRRSEHLFPQKTHNAHPKTGMRLIISEPPKPKTPINAENTQ